MSHYRATQFRRITVQNFNLIQRLSLKQSKKSNHHEFLRSCINCVGQLLMSFTIRWISYQQNWRFSLLSSIVFVMWPQNVKLLAPLIRFDSIRKEKVKLLFSLSLSFRREEQIVFIRLWRPLYFCSFVCFLDRLLASLDGIYLWLMWKVFVFVVQ